jgi:acyl dehydratase/NAD(P)-dependent dehydrogenase (short-subunit alcohol dehydrogenase family)
MSDKILTDPSAVRSKLPHPAAQPGLTPARDLVISLADSQTFAELSGDYNPLHLDPIAARRLIFGSTVPHGIHIMLAGLEAVLGEASRQQRLRALRATFSAPASHDQPLTVTSSEAPSLGIQVTVKQCGMQVQNIVVTMEDGDVAENVPVLDVPDWRRNPLSLTFADLIGRSGAMPLALDRALLRERFPCLSRILPVHQLAILIASTRIVGMDCPGLHSVFAEFSVNFDKRIENPEASLRYRILRTDQRMSLIQLGLDGPGTKGEITALVRPPVTQSSAATIGSHVKVGEFAGQRAVVIGGSRGLGEVTAKLISMGGGDVAITFAHGRDDAIAVAQDITSAGGRCNVFAFDVLNPPVALDRTIFSDFRPTHLYFFATPSIQLVKGRPFDNAKFDLYCDFYVGGVARTLAAIDRLFEIGALPLRLLYPSTVFIDELPAGAAEYAAAKAAGEVACRSLARVRRGLNVSCPRLPMLKTDQTSSRRGDATDPVPCLLSVLLEIR